VLLADRSNVVVVVVAAAVVVFKASSPPAAPLTRFKPSTTSFPLVFVVVALSPPALFGTGDRARNACAAASALAALSSTLPSSFDDDI